MKKITTSESMAKLCHSLKHDREYYFAWQRRIAMQFLEKCTEKFPFLDENSVLMVANDAAKNFLDDLIENSHAIHS